MIPAFITVTVLMLWAAGKVNIYTYICIISCSQQTFDFTVLKSFQKCNLELISGCFLCFRFSGCAHHSVAPLHRHGTECLGRNALLPEWHWLPIYVLVQAEREKSPVNSDYSRSYIQLWRRIQIWFSGSDIEGEAVVSDSTERSEWTRGCLSVCCQSTQWCGRPQVCDKNIQRGGWLLFWHLTHINNSQIKEGTKLKEKMISETFTTIFNLLTDVRK